MTAALAACLLVLGGMLWLAWTLINASDAATWEWDDDADL